MNKFKPLAATGLVAASILASLAYAAYPDRPIRLILPFVPGGSSDLVARVVAAKAQGVLGQPIIIDNRAGGGGIVATVTVAKAVPDGYTLLFAQTSHAANPYLVTTPLQYDTVKDFSSIALLADHPGVIVANPSKPYKTVTEFLAYSKANPGKVVYASAGIGTWPHLTMALLAQQSGLKMVHVPYKGAAPSRVDLLAGRVDLKVEAFTSTAAFIKDGTLRAIAVTGKERIADIPDVPTIAESGFPGFDSSIWMGVLGPAGMQNDVITKLQQAFVNASKDPAVVKELSAQGIYARGLPGKDLTALIQSEMAKWSVVIKAAGIVAE